jgi:hypothetical protein
MSQVVSCPECSTRLKVPDLAAGRAAKCPKCQAVVPLRLPAAVVHVDEDPEAASEPEPLPRSDEGPPPEDRPAKKSAAKGFSVAVYAFMAVVYLVGLLTGWFATQLEVEPPVRASGSASQPATHRSDSSPSGPSPADVTPPQPKPAVDEPPPAQEKVAATALMRSFLGSNSGSLAWYGGKWLEVTGTVADLRFDAGDVVIVQLDGGNPWRKVVRCTMRPSQVAAAKKLQNGQSVVIRGRCDGHTRPGSGVAGDTTVDVLLGDCYVIEAK